MPTTAIIFASAIRPSIQESGFQHPGKNIPADVRKVQSATMTAVIRYTAKRVIL